MGRALLLWIIGIPIPIILLIWLLGGFQSHSFSHPYLTRRRNASSILDSEERRFRRVFPVASSRRDRSDNCWGISWRNTGK